MSLRAWTLALAALLAALPARAAVELLPSGFVAAAAPGAAPAPHLDPGPSLDILPLAAAVAHPEAADALAPLRGGNLLEVGAGAQALLAKHMVASLGFSPGKVYAVDPQLRDPSDSAVPAGHFRRIGAESLPADWNGLFDNVVTFFTFNPEIVDGSTVGMGRGIDVEAAAERLRAVLKPGGRLIVVTGAANGLHEGAQRAFASRLTPKAALGGVVHVFEAPR